MGEIFSVNLVRFVSSSGESFKRQSVMLFRLTSLLILIVITSSAVYAQNTGSSKIENSSSDDHSSATKSSPLGTPEQEMLARHSIKSVEHAHKENLERVREGALIAAALHADYARESVFSQNNLKKLEKLEKIVRKVRSEAGGSDASVEIEDHPPDLLRALERLAEMSAELRDQVEKTPRQVVSATVINCSNEILEIVRLVRAKLPR